MYASYGATGTISGASFTAATYQDNGVLRLTMFSLGTALLALTLLFALMAIAGLLPKSSKSYKSSGQA